MDAELRWFYDCTLALYGVIVFAALAWVWWLYPGSFRKAKQQGRGKTSS
jgi:hypothetical protein